MIAFLVLVTMVGALVFTRHSQAQYFKAHREARDVIGQRVSGGAPLVAAGMADPHRYYIRARRGMYFAAATLLVHVIIAIWRWKAIYVFSLGMSAVLLLLVLITATTKV